MTEQYIYPTSSLSTYPPMYSGCFRVLASVSNAAMNMGIQLFFQVSVFLSFGHTPRSGIIGSYGSSVSLHIPTTKTCKNDGNLSPLLNSPPFCFHIWGLVKSRTSVNRINPLTNLNIVSITYLSWISTFLQAFIHFSTCKPHFLKDPCRLSLPHPTHSHSFTSFLL